MSGRRNDCVQEIFSVISAFFMFLQIFNHPKLMADQIPLDDDMTIRRAYCYYKLEYTETTRVGYHAFARWYPTLY